jgi:hypothetical protein
MLNLLILVFSLLLALSVACFSYGCLFGMVALPTLVTKTSHKYCILITGMLVPYFCGEYHLFKATSKNSQRRHSRAEQKHCFWWPITSGKSKGGNPDQMRSI